MPPVTLEDYVSDDNESIETASDIDSNDDCDDDSDYDPDNDSESGDESDMDVEFPPMTEDFVESEDEEMDEHANRGRHAHTELLQSAFDGKPKELVDAVKDVLLCMTSKGLDIVSFMHAFSWGTPECTSDHTIRQSRSLLMTSPQLPEILMRWYRPPRPPGSTNVRPRGAADALQNVMHEYFKDTIEKELLCLYKLVYNSGKMMKEDEVTKVHIQELTERMEASAPTLWRLLVTVAQSKSQKKRNGKKSPEQVCTYVFPYNLSLKDFP